MNKKHRPIAFGVADVELAEELSMASSQQVGGDHYKTMAIQPAEYSQRNGLNFIEGCVVKYVSRHRNKNGAEDIKKAIHFLNMLIEIEYNHNE